MTGDFYSAQEAYNWGEVDKVVPPEKMEETALAMANKLSKFDQMALKITKQALWKIKGMSRDEARLYSWDLLASHAASEKGQKTMQDYRTRTEKATGRPHVPGA